MSSSVIIWTLNVNQRHGQVEASAGVVGTRQEPLLGVALIRLTCLQLVREARRNLHLGRDRRLVGGFGVPSITSSKGSSL